VLPVFSSVIAGLAVALALAEAAALVVVDAAAVVALPLELLVELQAASRHTPAASASVDRMGMAVSSRRGRSADPISRDEHRGRPVQPLTE